MKLWENVNDPILENEIWKIIEDFPEYQVSNLGRIKSFKQDKINGKILKQLKDNITGYLKIRLWKNNKGITKNIHVLVYEVHFNELKSGKCIHHIDENKENNYYENLKMMIQLDHESFHWKKEKNPNFNKNFSGENNFSHKLKDGEVWLIKKILDSDYYKSGKITQEFIGKMFKVTQETISYIKIGKIWSNIGVK